MSLFLRSLFICAFALAAFGSIHAEAQNVRTIEDYNASLITNGISWKEGQAVYYPSFYTGFAPRVEDPNRIHFHLSRGNQARLTSPLDEMTVLTYLYGLKKRSEIYTAMIQSKTIVPLQHKLVDSYRSIISSDSYNILQSIDGFEKGQISREQFYQKSLATLKALNPGRVFDIRIDLRAKALAWRDSDLKRVADDAHRAGANDTAAIKSYLGKNSKDAIVVTNNLLLGRINDTFLSDSQLLKLAGLISAVASPTSDNSFVESTVDYFNDVTAGRYAFRVVVNGQYRNAVECSPASSCTLAYSELTAIYPNGSVRQSVNDRDGNLIPMIRENGVTKFVERSYHDVDHIRQEPYYGYIPKMDYTNTGNGIHNPAVRTYLPSAKYKGLHDTLGIPKTDDTLWIVSRGEVSHGCTRFAAGHVLEVREIFPSNPRRMTSLNYTGNNSTDYDLFDVDGSGQLRVMGVDYLIAYAIVSDSGNGYREGNGLVHEAFQKDAFYNFLYGKNQFVMNNNQYVFTNPYISYFIGKPTDDRANAFSVQVQGNYPLYEQAYEKDKLQFYDIPKVSLSSLSENTNNKTNKGVQLVRLLGRINACGPFAKEFKTCNETGFEVEMSSVLNQLK
jgi:hypothetical protein